MKSIQIQIVFLLLVGLLSVANAGFGPCPVAPIEHNDFNATDMRGLWYLYSTSNGYYDAYRNECRTDLIMSKSDDITDLDFKVFTSSFDKNTNRTQRFSKQMIFDDVSNPTCSIKVEGGYLPTTMTVMKTDHFSYAVVSVCKNIGLYHFNHFEVLTRDKLPSKYHRNLIATTTRKFGYHHKTDFRRVPTIECYKPDPQRRD